MLTLERLEIRQDAFGLTANFSFPERAITAAVGPSGAGKSTLLSVIGGFSEPVAGRVMWQGDDITARSPGRRPIATLFQDNNLFPHLTLRQNIGLALRPSLRLSAGEAVRVEQVLTEVGLGGMSGRKPAALSGGQASRAALARVLLQDKPVVLLDEPFSALGPALKAEMLDLVAETLIGRTVVMVTHDPQDARRIASHLVVVDSGVARPPRPLPEALDRPDPALAAYLGAL